MTEALERFLAQRPAVRLQYEHEGAFRDYSRHFFHRIPVARGTRLRELIIEYARAQICIPVDDRLLRAQLDQYPLVSSADHAGVLHQSILYNANLLFSGMLDLQSLPYQVVLATARVPLDNASFPRGIIFQNQKLSVFSTKNQYTPVWLLNDGIRAERGRGLEAIFRPEGLKSLQPDHREFLEFLFFETVNLPRISRSHSIFADQLAAVNQGLWHHYFSRSYRMSRPVLLTFPLDHFVRELLLMDLADPESLPSRILFDPQVRQIYLEEFDGIAGCWTKDAGTHFFWGVDARSRLLALRVDPADSCLKPLDETRTWEPLRLDPESLSEALSQKRILPALFFDMLMVAFLEGYTLMGGFNQVTYMAWMRVGHERAMLRLGDWPRAAQFARTLTDGLVCGPLPFPQWTSGFDLLWHFNSTEGKFNGNMEGGLDRRAMDQMMGMPIKTMLQNGVAAMLQVID